MVAAVGVDGLCGEVARGHVGQRGVPAGAGERVGLVREARVGRCLLRRAHCRRVVAQAWQLRVDGVCRLKWDAIDEGRA